MRDLAAQMRETGQQWLDHLGDSLPGVERTRRGAAMGEKWTAEDLRRWAVEEAREVVAQSGLAGQQVQVVVEAAKALEKYVTGDSA